MRDVAESIMALSDEELERDYRNSNEDAKKIIYELVKVARARRANQTVGEVAAEKIFEGRA